MAENANTRRTVQTILVVYIAAMGVFALGGGVWAWRVAERASADPKVSTVSTSFLGWHFSVSVETSIFLIALMFGIVGSTVHSANSLASYIGNRRFGSSWAPWYFLRPLIAAALAMLAYTVFRAGFLSTKASPDNINLFGVAAIAGLAGLFSKQVIDKLEDVMKVVFASNADAARSDKLQSIVITGISPESTPAGTEVPVVITGTGFGPGAKVVVGEDERDPTVQTDDTITVALTATDVAAAGTLELRVKSASGDTSAPTTFTIT